MPPDQGRHVFFEDSGLFRCYLRTGAAQHCAVVQADAGNYRELREDDVRAVQTASKAGFDYCGIYFSALEPPEGHSCSYLEKGELGEVVLIAVQKLEDLFF